MGISGYPYYEKIRFLGEGGFGSVEKIKDKKDNQIYALKKIKKSKVKVEVFKNEVNILSKFNSDKIVKYYSSFSDKDYFYIKMEYCNCSNLSDFISNKKQESNNLIDENILCKIIYNICLSVQEIHSKEIIHRDLNPNNIFMHEDYNIKIGDFGISKHCDNTKTNVGTQYYKAPEILLGKVYNNKIDIWALGCILYELFTLENCFYCEYDTGFINNILNNYHGKINKKYNIIWQFLIDSLLDKNHKNRPNIDEICDLVTNLSNRIQIYVKLISNKTFVLDVIPLNTIKNIKEIIKDKEGIPLEEQNLIYSGKRLLDDKTLEYYDIGNEFIIFLLLKRETIQIFIQVLNGKTIIFNNASQRDTIGDIKLWILVKEGIIQDQYKLIFSGTELEDDRELIYYNIQNESYIQLVPVIFKIFIDYLKIKTIEIDVEYSDTIENIKQKIKDKEINLPNYYKLTFDSMELKNNLTLRDYNIKANFTIDLVKINIIQIFVENLNGKKIVLEVEYSDTIKDIKNKINFKQQNFSLEYKLLFDGINLKDNKTLKDYNINENSIIYLQYYKDIKIFIEMNEKKIELNAKTSDTISHIKFEISWIKRKLDESIDSNKFKLIFDGIKLEDKKTLEDYNIVNNSIIYLQYYRKFEILIVNEKQKILLNVEENERIINIKDKLEGIPPYEYKLEFEGKKLEEYKYVVDYNLNNGCIIYLIYCPFKQIHIRTLTGKNITLYAQESETISYIKEKIYNMANIPVGGQLLIYKGKYLEDDKTLSDYNIQNYHSLEFIIHLSLRLRGGH